MRNTAFGRCLVDLGKALRNNLIRSALFLSLSIFAVVFSLHADQDKLQNETANHSGGQQELHESFWGRLSDPVAIFTLALTISTTGLWFATWRASQNQVRDMRRSTNIMALQTDTLIKQKEISRLQYFATHRPRLVIRSIALTIFDVRQHATVEMTVANSGSSEAVIREANITFDIQREDLLPPLPRYDTDRLWLLNMHFPPGRNNPVYKTTGYLITDWQYDAVMQGFGGLFLYGFINYEDGINQRRGLGFCYRYDQRSRRFQRVSDPNYEYID